MRNKNVEKVVSGGLFMFTGLCLATVVKGAAKELMNGRTCHYFDMGYSCNEYLAWTYIIGYGIGAQILIWGGAYLLRESLSAPRPNVLADDLPEEPEEAEELEEAEEAEELRFC